jgi:hypothetical protein
MRRWQTRGIQHITTIVGKQKQPLDYDFLIHRILEYVSICFLMFPFLSFKIFKLVQPLQCSIILLMMLLMMIKDVQCISMSMNSPNSPGCAGSCAGQWGPKAWEVHGCRGWLQRIDVWDGAEVACNDGNDGNDCLGRPWDAMTPWRHDAMPERHWKTYKDRSSVVHQFYRIIDNLKFHSVCAVCLCRWICFCAWRVFFYLFCSFFIMVQIAVKESLQALLAET